jgi:putative PIN family toxin of toxin-antitoxin system
MNRLVLDTNVVVSALLAPGGNEAAVLRIALAGGATICLSPSIVAEYRAVLARPAFRFDPRKIAEFLRLMDEHAEYCQPRRRATGSPDEADNRFLECAESAGANFLVTGNRRHFPRWWKETEIVSARELLERILPENTL